MLTPNSWQSAFKFQFSMSFYVSGLLWRIVNGLRILKKSLFPREKNAVFGVSSSKSFHGPQFKYSPTKTRTIKNSDKTMRIISAIFVTIDFVMYIVSLNILRRNSMTFFTYKLDRLWDCYPTPNQRFNVDDFTLKSNVLWYEYRITSIQYLPGRIHI